MSETPHPERIQRKRTKGWRLPDNCVYVGRPTKFGNPFRLVGDNEHVYCDASHRRKILDPWVVFDPNQRTPGTQQMVIELYARWITGEFDEAGIVRPREFSFVDLWSLRGKDLACWCPLEKPCHADVLLKEVNALLNAP